MLTYLDENMDLALKIRKYFIEYNKRFFDNKLQNLKIEFSDKMTSSAGIFYPPKKPENCSVIRLNQPMLLLRSDKELMETLLVSYNSSSR